MPYDLQMKYTSLHIPKKLYLKFRDSACASVPHDARNYNTRLSLATNPVHETSSPSNIDVIREAYESAYNQTNNDDSFMMHTETQDMLSTTIRNHIPTSSLGTFGIQNNSFSRGKNVTNDDIKIHIHWAVVRKRPQMHLDIEQRMFLQNLQKRQSQAKCGKIHAAEKRVADEFINNNGQIIFRASATSSIGHRQKQYATRIHQHISHNQQVSPLKKVPFEYGHLGKATIEEYMNAFPELTSADQADIVDRIQSNFRADDAWPKWIHANSKATCMKDRSNCNRNFPKPYSDRTFVDKDGYVHYRRHETRVDIERYGVQLDN
nr:DNA helicase [Tanacetum cinerariifolium]